MRPRTVAVNPKTFNKKQRLWPKISNPYPKSTLNHSPSASRDPKQLAACSPTRRVHDGPWPSDPEKGCFQTDGCCKAKREFPKTRGTLFEGPYNEDATIWGTILGSPIFGNSQMPRIFWNTR